MCVCVSACKAECDAQYHPPFVVAVFPKAYRTQSWGALRFDLCPEILTSESRVKDEPGLRRHLHRNHNSAEVSLVEKHDNH